MTFSSAPDPTREPGRYDALFAMLRDNDAAIEALYTERGVSGIRSRFVLPLIRLAHEGPMTISDLARSLGRTHSATSQTVAAARREGLLESVPGADARTRVLRLTDAGLAAVPLMEAEWRATEGAIADLDDETGRALSDAVVLVREALARRPFGERLRDHLEVVGHPSSDPAGG